MRTQNLYPLTPGNFVVVVAVLYVFANGGVIIYRIGGLSTLNLVFFLVVAIGAVFCWSLNHYRRQRSDASR